MLVHTNRGNHTHISISIEMNWNKLRKWVCDKLTLCGNYTNMQLIKKRSVQNCNTKYSFQNQNVWSCVGTFCLPKQI